MASCYAISQRSASYAFSVRIAARTYLNDSRSVSSASSLIWKSSGASTQKIPKSKSRLENRGVRDFNVRGNKGAKENTPCLDLRFHTSPKKNPTRMKPPRARMRKSAPRGGGSDPAAAAGGGMAAAQQANAP